MLFEDNITYIAHIKREYIRLIKINHISPKFFLYELQKSDKINCV